MTNKKLIEKDQVESITDFGFRQLNTQNFSKTVVLPKTALSNCGCNLDEDIKVNVQLVQRGREKFIKLIPVCDTNKSADGTVEEGK